MKALNEMLNIFHNYVGDACDAGYVGRVCHAEHLGYACQVRKLFEGMQDLQVVQNILSIRLWMVF